MSAPSRNLTPKFNRRSPLGIAFLSIIPIAAFGLGTWQIYRRREKLDLIAHYEGNLARKPILIPGDITPQDVSKYDHRRVLLKGEWQNDKEMLVGPRMREGDRGFHVYVPFQLSERSAEPVIVNRGWVSHKFKDDKVSRAISGETIIQAMFRKAAEKNSFTPANIPQEGLWLFPDVEEMAQWTGSRPLMLEQIFDGRNVETGLMAAKGEPIGRKPEIMLRNHHLEYIFTWYTLGIATTIGLYLLLRKPPSNLQRRVRAAQ